MIYGSSGGLAALDGYCRCRLLTVLLKVPLFYSLRMYRNPAAIFLIMFLAGRILAVVKYLGRNLSNDDIM